MAPTSEFKHDPTLLGRVLRSPTLRTEAIWVLVNRAVEFALFFLLLKVLTNVLGKEGFGEYNLADSALLLIANVLLVPVHDPYFRDYHGARERGESRASGVLLLQWYLGCTLGVALLAALSTSVFSRSLGLHPGTVLAAGLVFFFERWRFLGQEALNIRRERRAWALQNMAYFGLQVALISVVVTRISPTPSAALFAYAGASALFAVPSAWPLVREIWTSRAGGHSSRMPQLVRVFGVPTAILLVFQWIQGFTDRWLLTGMADLETVGHYVACYQVCGVPFQFMLRLAHSLLTPIAFERGRDVEDATQVWAADRVLLVGIAGQAVLGLLMVALLAAFGSEVVTALTSPEYALPTHVIALLAAGRFIQSLSQSLQPIFAVHHKMGSMLRFRLAGALLTVAICWWAIYTHGVLGAAAGSLVALTLYSLGLVFAPNGCWTLVRDARRRAQAFETARPRDPAPVNP